MGTDGVLARGRVAYAQGDWADVVTAFSAVESAASFELGDLEHLAVAAYLVGEDTTSDDAWARAYQECVRCDDHARAVRCAFWLAFRVLNAGDLPLASGWIARAQRMLGLCDRECVEQGYVGYLVALRAIFAGDVAAAGDGFREAAEIGDRFDDPDLMTLARLGHGRALIYLDDVDAGMALLDEAMVAVTAGEVSPIVAGDTYCSVIEACRELYDVRRAQTWTAALSRWCDAQPGLVPYRGQCLIHRAEIMQLRGEWDSAVAEAERARKRLTHPAGQPAVGAAWYRLADLHRLRGEFVKAEQGYRRAHELGSDPQPGMILLRWAQGRADAAVRRAVAEADDRIARARLLPVFIEIVLAEGDTAAARSAAEELAAHAAALRAPLLRASAAYAAGAVALAEDDVHTAMVSLREACAVWRELDAPYELARAQVLIGSACAAVGDEDGAALEFGAACDVFARLGAKPDLERLHSQTRSAAPGASHRLTERELQVLRLVVVGETNRAIAAELVLSERTVDRHVSNILSKLGVSSRAAATAYAYENRLL